MYVGIIIANTCCQVSKGQLKLFCYLTVSRTASTTVAVNQDQVAHIQCQ